MFNLREGFVNLREEFVVAPWRLREAFSKIPSAKASRRRHGRLHLETIRQIMTSSLLVSFLLSDFPVFFFSGRVLGLVWFGSIYLETTARFVADQLIM